MNWLNPLNKLIMMRAFRSRASEVTLKNGLNLALRYEPTNNGCGSVFVQATNRSNNDRTLYSIQSEFVPCGWFDLATCLSPTGDWFDQDNFRDTPSI